MAGKASQDDDGLISEINVTPLVDIVLVLLIIFMVTAKLITDQMAMKVNLPKATTGESTGGSLFSIVVPLDGKLYLNGKETTEADIVSYVKAEKSQGKSPKVVVSGDAAVDYGRVVKILDLVRKAGVSDYAISVQGEAK